MTAPVHLHKLNSIAAFMANVYWEDDPKHAALFALSHLEPPPACLICRQAAEEPAIVGWTDTTTFVVCHDCHRDCPGEAELERKIAEQISGDRPTATPDEPAAPTAHSGPPSAAAERVAHAKWVNRAAAEWAEPLARPPAA
jgi:hypothetical protein